MRPSLLASSVAPSPAGGGLSSLSEPLIPKTDDDEKATGEDGDGGEAEAPLPLSSVGVIIGAVLLSAAGIAASAAAIVSAAGFVAVYVAGGLCVVNSMRVVKNQYELSKGKGFREGANEFRREANRLKEEADLLTTAVKDLETEANVMKAFESQLSDITSKQGASVNELVSLIKENEEILMKQRANLKKTFMSDISKAFITSEFLTGDMKIDLKNLPILMMRLSIQLNSHGMELNTVEFEDLVRKNNDVSHIIKCCGDMLSLTDKGIAPNANVSNLVTLTPEYSKGSVEVARGKRLNLSTKPKLEHRNTVVRDVKRGLSMKGIEVDLDSSSDEEGKRLFDSPPCGMDTRTTRKHRVAEKEVKSKASSKFKAAATAARTSRLQAGDKRVDEAQDHRRGDKTSAQQDVRSTKANTKRKFKSAALLAVASSNTRKLSDDEQDVRSTKANTKGKFKSAALLAVASSNTRKLSDDVSAGSGRRTSRRHSNAMRSSFSSQSSGTGSTGRDKSMDRKSRALRKSGVSRTSIGGDDSESKGKAGDDDGRTRSCSSQSRGTRSAGRDKSSERKFALRKSLTMTKGLSDDSLTASGASNEGGGGRRKPKKRIADTLRRSFSSQTNAKSSIGRVSSYDNISQALGKSGSSVKRGGSSEPRSKKNQFQRRSSMSVAEGSSSERIRRRVREDSF